MVTSIGFRRFLCYYTSTEAKIVSEVFRGTPEVMSSKPEGVHEFGRSEKIKVLQNTIACS